MRLIAVIALVVAAAVAVAAVASSGGGDSHKASGTPAQGKTKQAQGHKAAAAPPKVVSGPHDKPVPILMYHVISDPKPGAPFPDLYTPEPVFAAQMDALSHRGYHGVTLKQVDDYWRKGYALPSKPIVISFDDGYVSHYTHAAPVLQRLGWPGVLNLEINNVARPGNISPSRVRKLVAAGWEIDSHTMTHPDLTAIGPQQLHDELVRSRAYLRSRFGVAADYFCYPAGRYNATVEAAVRKAGYRMATTTVPGLASAKGDPYALARIRVAGKDGASGLLAKLANPGTVQNGYSGG
jgi:peptidoglycan/xylan/chitin deacetylase (PgdA/CDA1 family)